MAPFDATRNPPIAGRRALQIAICLACIVPISAGLAGMVSGTRFITPGTMIDLDSHTRYLSGLLFALGLIFLSCVPQIEARGSRFRLAMIPVVIGGLARLIGVYVEGWPSWPMSLALIMELIVTPGLAIWQSRVAARALKPVSS